MIVHRTERVEISASTVVASNWNGVLDSEVGNVNRGLGIDINRRAEFDSVSAPSLKPLSRRLFC